MTKWKKAVIHLECATNSEHFSDRIKRIQGLQEDLSKGKITEQQFAEQMGGKIRDIRYHGTAIFLANGPKRYLLTARHVLWDELAAKSKYEEEARRAQDWPGPYLELAKESIINNIFGIIFRVPSLDEMMQSVTEPVHAFLMNLGAGTPSTAPYTFSTPELDLAIISLDQRDSTFADELLAHGYEPITLADIADGPSSEGCEIFTVGFPSSTALIGQMRLPPALANWRSSFFSLPTFSFGRVSMLHDSLRFFWADMSIYPGNSGGPVIENNKMVGIVSAQPTIPLEESEELRTRIPFGKIIKAKFVADLLNAQEEKDRPW
jgi:Trypsin-like peptidase domain